MLEINRILAFATLILAIVGIFQALAAHQAANEAKRQADSLDKTLSETKKSADAAVQNADAAKEQVLMLEKTFLLTHRPKLILRNVVINRGILDGSDDPFYQGARVAGQFYIANIGDTRATVMESGCWVIWKKNEQPLAGLPMRRPYEGKNGNNPVSAETVLQPGESLPGIFQSDDFLGHETQRVREANWPFYVMGWVEYTDDAGTRRRTAFCQKYDASKRFVAVVDPDYEHAE